MALAMLCCILRLATCLALGRVRSCSARMLGGAVSMQPVRVAFFWLKGKHELVQRAASARRHP